MKEWWQSKTPQEHMALIIGAAAILLLLVYLLLWRPFNQALDKKALLVESQQLTLNWMQDNLDLVKNLRSQQRGKSAGSNEALLTLVDRTAKKIRLRQQIQRIKPQGDNAVQLWIEEAPFDTIIKWLGQLTQTHAIEIDSLTIDRQDKPGLVNARLVLQREGGS
ncbi:MAG: type II secretion system protein M [Candidatus Thiodiazotropha endolucinida]|uniref:Type II secretion system protein M n=1 Tax=Candidatus Thiodiazotropha taylori TaxID=2792791 RepID=A0A9E4MVG7_9GAMM|nr:type II secretion system protein M [Candidatus Thiodiazotropha sp. (ex Lucina pensylvanica)]MBT3023244.1 type II secretion system protein M [Candidatus Thiodiazotropha taylori]MBT3038283.1 type II secretion system protein M [Candidatus Thiodiazotropha sp. (ex Codakia orbicularis)]MBV2103021.1 type II secretion system protein M [Candidatus Thiodiazotropha sp. (ex Lucina aurantia)]MCG7861489.1 type II secretion system protein M [Candidatus Thiodiazotropha endolucinida]MCU7942672.1 type II sec